MIVIFAGGLGNQLFQLAYALTQAEKDGRQLVYNDARFNTHGLRRFELADLCSRLGIAHDSRDPLNWVRAKTVIIVHVVRALQFGFRKLGSLDYFGSVVSRKLARFGVMINFDYHFHQFLVDSPRSKNAHIAYGYFQSDKYFSRSVGIRLRDLLLNGVKHPLSAHLNGVLVCSIRVGGDYRNSKNLGRKLPEDYIRDIKTITSQNSDIFKVVVFSDDIERAEKEIALHNGSVELEFQNLPPLEQIYILSKAKYQYISNSSFSWWGAYFNSLDANGTVFAPKTWFGFARRKTDVHMNNWILLDD